MSELMSDDRDALQAALAAALTDEALAPVTKKARDLADIIAESVEWSVKDYLAANLAYHVKEMAGRAVNALLEGNEGEMVRWLGCDSRGHNGRSDGYNANRTIDEQHPVIHGKLFDTGSVALRRKIVEAHRDLIAEQRVLDLEDQVKSLVAQNNKLAREREEMWQRVRDLQPV